MELKKLLLFTGAVKSTDAYSDRSALGLSVMTMILAPASCAIFAVSLSMEEYRGKLKMIRQSSLEILQIWSMGLMGVALVISTLGTICFRYSRK